MERMEREREERKEIIEQASTYLVNLCYVDLLFFSSSCHGCSMAQTMQWKTHLVTSCGVF